ncbi:hypothetical protein GE061_000140 [Apolygus lucorum]|uniref:Peptidase C1A papain C-terminal domain-containing protein n=1 Tax=Apolygus lucorum TaxID=248454 RepID=A0A6A4KBV8_APOLU|nr:hypothetical protein GE061_000140 [Apolygus lucorum]
MLMRIEAFLFSAAICCAAKVTPAAPKWPSGASVSFEHEDLLSDFKIRAQHYLSRAQKSARWDINGGASKIYLSYKDLDTSGMYYYHPVTSAGGKNETACHYYPSTPVDVATPEIPASVFFGLDDFYFERNVTVRGIQTEHWKMMTTNTLNYIYVSYDNYSGKIEPGLVEAVFNYTNPTSRRNPSWANSKKVFTDYKPSEPGLEVWERPKDVECKEVDGDVGQYMVYLLATYMALPMNQAIYQLFNDPTNFYLMSSMRMNQQLSTPEAPAEDDQVLEGGLPKSWDWRKHGAVTEVKDQGICAGGSWAFGIVGALEGAYFLKTQKLVNLSEQALIDCSWEFGNSGCFRGSPSSALEWVMHYGGLPLTQDYGRFQEGHGHCEASKFKLAGPFTKFVQVEPKTSAVKLALIQHGPLVAKMVVPYNLRYYQKGDVVYNSAQGGPEHYVVLIGYGTLNGDPYWLIKNSWSTKWGIDGYGMISSEALNILDSVHYVEM